MNGISCRWFRSRRMLRAGCRCVLSCLALFAVLGIARADDTENRDFSIFVDGKATAPSRMTLIQKDDGPTYMSATVDVKFRHLLILDYSIKVKTQEWWKKGQLV